LFFKLNFEEEKFTVMRGAINYIFSINKINLFTSFKINYANA